MAQQHIASLRAEAVKDTVETGTAVEVIEKGGSASSGPFSRQWALRT